MLRTLGVMIDCSRDAVYTVETLKEYIKVLAAMGYNALLLYMEDVYELEGEPYFGYLRGKYTKNELREIDEFAKNSGIELIPCIQTLAHLGGITRWNAYKDFTDTGDILLAEDERTYILIEKMFAACASSFTSRRINIGMDEAHMVGLGKYLDRHGYQDRYSILLKHLHRVLEIASRYGFRPMMWSDMFFRLAAKGEYYCNKTIPQEIINAVPEGVELIYWDYYSIEREHYKTMLAAHKQFRNGIVFAGGAWSWSGFAPANRFSMRANYEALHACAENDVQDVFVTSWKDDGAECSLFATLPAMLCFAEYARGNYDIGKISTKFKAITGIAFDDYLLADDVNLSDDTAARNPSKYMLYNDLFLGIFDCFVKETDAEKFTELKERLDMVAKNKRYGYIFRTLSALCGVLEIKYSLGNRTRQAYRAGDRAALEHMQEEYTVLIRRLKKLYRLFRAQWDKECKPNGFEKHDIRFGGLIFRTEHCRKQIEEYCRGKRKDINMLNEDILPFDQTLEKGQYINFNRWHNTAMIKPLQ